MRRLFLAALLFLFLGPLPGTHQRGAEMQRSDEASATALDAAPPASGALHFRRAWRLDSRDSRFGGFSALTALSPDALLAVADNGHWTRIDLARDRPGLRLGALPKMGDERRSKGLRDVEAMAADPGGKQVWLALEGDHQLWRLDGALARIAARRRLPGRDWGSNGGAEALARLADGRFLLITERRLDKRATEGLLYAYDPVAGGDPLHFRYDAQGKGAVADAVALPDGRLLLVHRRLGWNPVFTTIVAIADPATIAPGGVLQSRAIGTVPRELAENYEGAAVARVDGQLRLWLISDNNFQRWQRTLLVEFDLAGV